MPSVEPIQVPTRPCSVANVTVASIVLSPSSARKNAIATVKNTDLELLATRAVSSSSSLSPRSVQAANPKNAAPATTEIAFVGMATPTAAPINTLKRCTNAVAAVMAIRIVIARYRAAKVIAISWLLSPSSATKMMPKLIRKASMRFLRVVARTKAGLPSTGHRLMSGRRSRSPAGGGPEDRGSSPSVSISRWGTTPLQRPSPYRAEAVANGSLTT